MKKIILVLFLAGLVTLLAFYSLNKKEEVVPDIKHSSTMNIIVKDKSKVHEPKTNFKIEVQNLSEPNQEFYIVIDDERLWNLINVNKEYFVLVEWVDQSMISEISGKKTSLLQIEYMNLD